MGECLKQSALPIFHTEPVFGSRDVSCEAFFDIDNILGMSGYVCICLRMCKGKLYSAQNPTCSEGSGTFYHIAMVIKEGVSHQTYFFNKAGECVYISIQGQMLFMSILLAIHLSM